MENLIAILRVCSLTVIGLWIPVASASKMSEVLDEFTLSTACKQRLITIADDVIGKKRHRILEKNMSSPDAFHAFVLLSYNDQDTHLSFTAFPAVQDDGAQSCVVNTTESYELPANCQDARNSIFKRWKMLGRMDAKTLVMRYDFPRKKIKLVQDPQRRAVAFLSQSGHGKTCMITKQQQNIPLPRKEEDK